MNDLELIETESDVEKQLEVWLRIACAFERIACCMELQLKNQPQPKNEETPFPWKEMSARTQNYLAWYVATEIKQGNPLYLGMKWPLTVENLISLGKNELLNAKNFGVVGWREIEAKLKAMGV